jgi:hypothetical protein
VIFRVDISTPKTFHSSLSMSYFDVSDYLAGDERVPCKFLISLTGMGLLDPTSHAVRATVLPPTPPPPRTTPPSTPTHLPAC